MRRPSIIFCLFFFLIWTVPLHELFPAQKGEDTVGRELLIKLLTDASDLIIKAKPELGSGALPQDVFERSAALLLEASQKVGIPAQQQYLQTLSKDIREGDLTSSNQLWLEKDVGGPDIIVRIAKKSKNTVAAVFSPLPEASTRVGQIIDAVDAMSAQTFAQVKSATRPPRVFPEFVVARLLKPEKFNRMVLIHPQPLLAGSAKFKVVVFENVIRSYYGDVLSPAAEKIYNSQIRRFIDFDAYFVHLILHKISHMLGPAVVDTKSDSVVLPEQRLKDIYYTIEEVKADTAAVINFSALGENKSAAQKNTKKALAIYILQLVSKLTGDLKSAEVRPFLIQFNFLLRQEGIFYNLEKDEILIDFVKAKKAVENLFNSVLKIEMSGDYSNAKKLVKDYSTQTNVVDRVQKLLGKTAPKLPRTNPGDTKNVEKK